MKSHPQTASGDAKPLIETLINLSARPALFEPGEPLFWDDPHISSQMLASHLDPETDAASRKPAAIDRTCDWLVRHFDLKPGARLLDLGCGPGLYAIKWAGKGFKVTGIDYSKRSIDYARGAAVKAGLDIEYFYQDYLAADYLPAGSTGGFDLITMIFCDFAVLSDEQEENLLGRVAQALNPGGRFVFDVFTPAQHPVKETTSWSATGGGFWNSKPYLALHRKFHYPEADAFLNRYLIVNQDLTVKDYRNWDRVFTPETIERRLAACGFRVDEIWGDLSGVSYSAETTTLGVVASVRDK